MSELASIPGIDEAFHELLEAAGFLDANAIARTGAEQLESELMRANEMLHITEQLPYRAIIEKWVHAAREIAGAQADELTSKNSTPVNYEQTEQGAAMLATAPFAIPLPAQVLVSHQLGLAEVPSAILFNSYVGSLDVRSGRKLSGNRSSRLTTGSDHQTKTSETASQRLDIDTTKLRSTQNLRESPVQAPVVKNSSVNERVNLLRAPRPETNKGRNPESRRYIRGVLHSHPLSITMGALVTLVLIFIVPTAVISSLLLLLSSEMPAHFSWVPRWFIAFPLILPLFGIFYLMWGMGGSCRICGQNLFRHRFHRKNNRAHHVVGLGYIVPLCFHILLFRWFRCTHCGTPVRLKE